MKYSALLLSTLFVISSCADTETTSDKSETTSQPTVQEILNQDKKPNIIFILTDDQRWDAMGANGNDIIKTPYMDKLANEGINFKNAFVTTPICASSRASLMTGMFERTHNFTFGKPKLDNRYMFNSYPYLLKQSGYATGFVGKWGMQVNEGIQDSLFQFNEQVWFPYNHFIDGDSVHIADIHGDHAIDFVKQNKDKPFCLSFSFLSPHAHDSDPEQYYWPEYVDSMYADVEIPLPATANQAFFDTLPEFMKVGFNRQRWFWRYDTEEKRQHMVKAYYKVISTVDSVIGRLQATLEEEGIADNTVIIFMGDNGAFLGERGFAGKWTMHEHSLRVPMMIYDPRIPASERGKTYEEMVLNIDITPTILDIAGVDIPKNYQGESLTDFYSDGPKDWRTSIFTEHLMENENIFQTNGYRDDTWKFIQYDNYDYIELYNHKEDFDETVNLAYNPDYADMVKKFKGKNDSTIAALIAQRYSDQIIVKEPKK
ncbi:MAG: sulfatase [Flavobacteriales bacterium]|nr:sulfatase [Flavobacteriales bacterium]